MFEIEVPNFDFENPDLEPIFEIQIPEFGFEIPEWEVEIAILKD